jgi:hypothetical protein
MACTHSAAMAVLGKLGGGHGLERRVAALSSAASRLLRAYATQVEALRRLRNGGLQFVRVEHVHVNDGGQVVIGDVETLVADPSGNPLLLKKSEGNQQSHDRCRLLTIDLASIQSGGWATASYKTLAETQWYMPDASQWKRRLFWEFRNPLQNFRAVVINVT